MRQTLLSLIEQYTSTQDLRYSEELFSTLSSPVVLDCFEYVLSHLSDESPADPRLSLPIDALDLSAHARRTLTECAPARVVRTIAQLAALSDKDLLRYRGIGEKTLAEIRSKLTAFLSASSDSAPRD